MLLPHLKSVALKPTTLSVTLLITLLYTVVFTASVLVHETLPAPPSKPHQRGLDLDLAWSDLQQITRVPHPYNSHANGRVRDYLLHRLRAIASGHSNVDVYDDLVSNGTYAGAGPQIVYFEGDNLLVKIEGQDPSLTAVLFSAHFDSVSTGLGATDDGMGVVTLVQLVQYYAAHKPQRTVVFNINNGEEDWLNGAHAFLDHPWSKLPATFLNLEGAGNGGRPMLFRTSSLDVTEAFRAVSRPHGSTLSSDAFKRGLVRSGTDFSVYEAAGMRGLDLAFYRQRSRYHTKYDSVAWLGNKASLWLMMENALEVGNALVSSSVNSTKAVDAVYFDILGRAIVVMSRGGMLALNIILLILGPLAVAVIVMTAPNGLKVALNKFGSNAKLWIHAPLVLLTCLISTLGLAAIYAVANTYIVYSSAYTVAISLISTALLTLILPSRLLSRFLSAPSSPEQTTANHAFFALFWWLLLCYTSGLVNVKGICGFYYVTFAYTGQMTALVFSLGSMLYFDQPIHEETTVADEGQGSDGSRLSDPTERTALLAHDGYHNSGNNSVQSSDDKSRCTWAIEILVSLLFPLILSTSTLLLLMTALSQTLADGNPPITVYLAMGFLSALIALPIAPFVPQLHRATAFFLTLVLLSTIFYNLFAFPFSPANPLKVYFQQSINLDNGQNRVQLVTVDQFAPVYSHMPSAGKVHCSADQNRVGLTNCAWNGTPPNVTLDSYSSSQWVSFTTRRLTEDTGEITVSGRNTRSCRIYSDTPVISLTVNGGHWERGADGPELGERNGFSEARLWSRTWSNTFKVQLTWVKDATNTLRRGRVACEWAEWDMGQIPALDEVITFLPPWAVVTKLADGLVEGVHTFELP